ncbi:MAG: Dabb family protein [Bacteroidales bacterium]|nr:Dabb family protein [Bacteroidales bacterium]MCF8343616.1 Dabb family protein [Bacteroidales bacterium]MCF8350961.1 Dabb family protein [Bacteroidales bacterium]MCF8374942.1 Dabb family protein [Bacteroidales bacterium]MCF8400079.1 Dabb family protein [Bacteroidales bacterium]
MVKHIVMIKLKEFDTAEEKQHQAKNFKQKLEDLVGKVPELLDMEVGLNFNPKPASYDLVLISEFESREGLDNYRVHPDHVKVLDVLKQIMEKTAVVDYER